MGTLGQVRIVLRGPERAPPALPMLAEFRRSEPGAIATLQAASGPGIPLVELHLVNAVKQGGRHGQFDEVVGMGVAIRVPGNRKLDPPLLYESTQAALEVALAFMHETFHVKLD